MLLQVSIVNKYAHYFAGNNEIFQQYLNESRHLIILKNGQRLNLLLFLEFLIRCKILRRGKPGNKYSLFCCHNTLSRSKATFKDPIVTELQLQGQITLIRLAEIPILRNSLFLSPFLPSSPSTLPHPKKRRSKRKMQSFTKIIFFTANCNYNPLTQKGVRLLVSESSFL